MFNQEELKNMEEIRRLKKEKNIYIIAHYYQRPEIQEIADFVGDSYAMAVEARNNSAKIILIAGVDFMAESAAILSPDKIIISPEPEATCPMANSIKVEDVLAYKEKEPDSVIVAYVNTPAEIKAVSDICCTSSNAVKIIEKIPADKKIYFIPDQYLAAHVQSNLDREIEAFPSSCPIHAHVKREEILKLKEQYPDAMVLVHPECKPEVTELADYIGSTGGIINYVSSSLAKVFIVATEEGILHAIRQANPDKELILASEELICPNMKSITLDKILYSLEKTETRIVVETEIREKAVLALEKMIEYAK